MHIQKYKPAMVSVVGMMLAHASGTPYGTATRPYAGRRLGGPVVPSAPPPGYNLAPPADRRNYRIVADGIRYFPASNRESRVKSIQSISITAFCRFVKDAVRYPGGVLRVTWALWSLQQNESGFAQFREQRIYSYDEELEAAVARSMNGVIAGVLAKLGNFQLGYNDHGDVRVFEAHDKLGAGGNGNAYFRIPNLRMLNEIESFTVLVKDNIGEVGEGVWIHQIWHAFRVLFPALKDLYLVRDPTAGRDLTVNEVISVGRCTDVRRLGMHTCIDPGRIKYLKGSAVVRGLHALILRGLRLQNLDPGMIGNIGTHNLYLYHALSGINDHELARVLRHRAFVDGLTKLSIRVTQDTDISEETAEAIAGLRNLQVLSLWAEGSECAGCVARIFDGRLVSNKFRKLVLAFSAISPSDLGAVADLGGLDTLVLSYRNITKEHLSVLGAGAAATSIRRLELEHADVCAVLGELAAFRNLVSLKLKRSTVSALPCPDVPALLAECRALKKLSIVGKKLPPPLLTLLATKHDLKVLVLVIDELSEFELATILAGKDRLRYLDIVGGSVAGDAASAVTLLSGLSTLGIRDATMSYSDILRLAGNQSFWRRMRENRGFRLRAKTQNLGEAEANVLRRHGLVYNEGTVIN